MPYRAEGFSVLRWINYKGDFADWNTSRTCDKDIAIPFFVDEYNPMLGSSYRIMVHTQNIAVKPKRTLEDFTSKSTFASSGINVRFSQCNG